MVTLFFRKRQPQFNSIEEIFGELIRCFEGNIEVARFEVSRGGAGPFDIFKNIKDVKRNRTKINHVTGHINYVILGIGNRGILTVHDIGSAFYGNFLHKLYIKLFWFWLPALKVKKITVISEFSRKELSKLIPFAKDKIVVIHNPVNSTLQYSPKNFNSRKPLILHIGTKSNKNLERTILALEGIVCRLLVIGSLSLEQLKLLEKSKIDYINKKHIPFSEIKLAYEECDLVSFISLYEGFGMPIIEAQAVGRPVITSAIEPIKEVAGEAACFVDPKDVSSIKVGFLKIIEDEKFRSELINKGKKNIERYQLKTIAAEYLELYMEVADA